MLYLFRQLFKIKFIQKHLLITLSFIHNFSYKLLTIVATEINIGVHPKNNILHYDRYFSDKINYKDNILDIGCGNGWISCKVAKKANKVIGIDIKKSNIETAKSNCHRKNVVFVLADATKYSPDIKIDKIILSNVLEHQNNRTIFLKKLHSISNTILLRVPLIERDWLSVYKKNHGLEYRLSHDHKIEYTYNGLEKELNKTNWIIKEYKIIFGEFWGVVVSDTI